MVLLKNLVFETIFWVTVMNTSMMEHIFQKLQNFCSFFKVEQVYLVSFMLPSPTKKAMF